LELLAVFLKLLGLVRLHFQVYPGQMTFDARTVDDGSLAVEELEDDISAGNAETCPSLQEVVYRAPK
jgi:hypothetical protein